ncbi:MAG: phosphatase PAP2 family protein [Clostridia bacterium]|nr:phosphatase PAP2 family protein [Clostridia bacterium]MBP5780555.1 phosphatase PAP2 family protein [Clostridia bacterium]
MWKKILISSGAMALFILLIILVRTVDVGMVEATGKTIGFFALNTGFHKLTGVNEGWYKLTQIAGYAAIAAGLVFAVIGLIQLIRRKSLWKVDRRILGLGVLFIVMAIVYVLFEFVHVNFRPVLMPGEVDEPEPSFPSSHTVLVCVVLSGVALMLNTYIKDKRLRISLQALCALVILITVFGRLICGVHWFTDIVGGILISVSLVTAFAAFLDYCDTRDIAKAEPIDR